MGFFNKIFPVKIKKAKGTIANVEVRTAYLETDKQGNPIPAGKQIDYEISSKFGTLYLRIFPKKLARGEKIDILAKTSKLGTSYHAMINNKNYKLLAKKPKYIKRNL